jgi:B3/4 domain.
MAKLKLEEQKNNESLITLEGIERNLDPSMLVIADSELPNGSSRNKRRDRIWDI